MPDLERTAAYDYVLPPGRIARYPPADRARSRLLAVHRGPGLHGALEPFSGRDLHFGDLPSLVQDGDLVVVNDSRVLPVRLLGRKPTGAPCEVLLLRPVEPRPDGSLGSRWEALVRPGSKLKPGRRVIVSPDSSLLIEEGIPGGGRIVSIESPRSVEELLETHGHIPLPPYIDRDAEPVDRERYQTVYARVPGSVAAPTAGLHFTPELLETLSERGVGVAQITLHIGPGTFRPVDADVVADHRMDHESWWVSGETASAVNRTRADGGRVWAVGTTVVRALETAALQGDDIVEGGGRTDLFIASGFEFRIVDALITNFHLPRSTLLMLVAAFAGYETTMAAYEHAIRSGYRFYSYGDAMAVLPHSKKGDT